MKIFVDLIEATKLAPREPNYNRQLLHLLLLLLLLLQQQQQQWYSCVCEVLPFTVGVLAVYVQSAA